MLGYQIAQEGKILFNNLVADSQIIQPISVIAESPADVEETEISVPDGTGCIVKLPMKKPVWLRRDWAFQSNHTIDFDTVLAYLSGWASQHENSLPPIIVNLSNLKNHPISIFKPFQTIKTQDGEALVFSRTDKASDGGLEEFLRKSDLLPRTIDISPRPEVPIQEITAKEIFKAGSRIGNYVIIERIGTGGIGAVYKANHGLLNQVVTVKINEYFSPDGVVGKAFLRSANYLSQLNHPNIIKLYDYGFQSDRAYMVMEFVEGHTLSGLIPKRQTENWTSRAIDIFVQLLSAIRYAHNCIYLSLENHRVVGIVHGDINPKNIFIDNEGLIKLSDFMIPDVQLHLGREISAYREVTVPVSPFTPSEKEFLIQQITGTGTRAFGTSGYMPPEQWDGKVSVKSDIFTLGATFYEMLTSHPPMALFNGVKPRQANPFIPEWIDEFISKAMNPDPLGRYDSVSEIETIFQKNLSATKSATLNLTIKEWIMGDKTEIQNTGTISNTGGQLFIGRFNDVIANLNTAGKTDFAEVLKVLKEAVMASSHIPDDKKQEHIEVINKLGEEAAKEKPNKTLLKAMGDGLLSVLKAIPDVAKAVTAVSPFFTHIS
jgi:serine/threonine protein kinase